MECQELAAIDHARESIIRTIDRIGQSANAGASELEHELVSLSDIWFEHRLTCPRCIATVRFGDKRSNPVPQPQGRRRFLIKFSGEETSQKLDSLEPNFTDRIPVDAPSLGAWIEELQTLNDPQLLVRDTSILPREAGQILSMETSR